MKRAYRDNPGRPRDTLTFGELGGDDLSLSSHYSFRRVAPLARASLFVDLAKQSAEIGAAVVRATNPESFPRARGPFELADLIALRSREESVPASGFVSIATRNVDAFRSGLRRPRRAALDPAALELLDRPAFGDEAGMEAGPWRGAQRRCAPAAPRRFCGASRPAALLSVRALASAATIASPICAVETGAPPRR